MTAMCQPFHSKHPPDFQVGQRTQISCEDVILSGFDRTAVQRRGGSLPKIRLSKYGMEEWRRTYEQSQSLTRSNIKNPDRLVVYQEQIEAGSTRLVGYQDSRVAA